MWLENSPPLLSCCCVDHPQSIPALSSIKWVDCCHALCSQSFNVLWTSEVCLDCTAFFCTGFKLFFIYVCGILQVFRTLALCNMAWRQRGCGGMSTHSWPCHLMGWVVIVRPWPPYLLGKTWCPLYRRLGGPKAGLGRCGKSCSSRLELWTTHLEPCACFC
jgi:hypothetical protein